MTARQAAGSGPLVEAVRSLQDMENQWQAADKQLSKALGDGNKNLADAARERMGPVPARLCKMATAFTESVFCQKLKQQVAETPAVSGPWSAVPVG